MTEQRELDTSNTQSPKTAVEVSAMRHRLYRFRYAAHRRFPRFFRFPPNPWELEAWRSRDPEENTRTSPPDDEFLDLRCMWAVEFYTPAHVDALLSGFRKLGWDNKSRSTIQIAPTSWIQRLRQSSHGGGYMPLDVIGRIPETVTFLGARDRAEPLPPQVQYMDGGLYSLTSSLICVVMRFVFEKDFSTQFDKALRTDRQTYIKSHTIYDPERQKIDHISQVRADMAELAGRWFCENLPGLFSSGILGGALPTCEFVILRQAEPFPPRREGNARPPEYLSVLGMDSAFGVWQSEKTPGLKFTDSHWRDRALQYHAILAGRDSDSNKEKFEMSVDEGVIFGPAIGALLSRWAILSLLEGYGQHLNTVRDSSLFRPGSRQSSVKILKTLGQHVSYSVDIAAVTAELVSYTRELSLFSYGLETFKPCDEQRYEAGFTLTDSFRSAIGERAIRLQKTDQSLRDHLAQYGSLLGAKENIRLQKTLRFLTVIIMLLTLALFLDSDTLPELLQWLRDRW